MIEKAAYLLSIFIGIIVANSCACFMPQQDINENIAQTKINDDDDNNYHNYGSYLAGRIAILRHDLNTAADYYKQSVPYAPDKQMLPSQLYIILTSQGRIDEAVKYADLAYNQGDKSPFIYTIKAINLIKNGKYQEAIEVINKSDFPAAKNFFSPLISAWTYAALNDQENAVKALLPLTKNSTLLPFYIFHAGAINDYLGNTTEAQQHYTSLMQLNNMELPIFSLQVIANFYLRQGEPDKALRAASFAINKDNLMMKTIIDNIKKSNTNVQPILQSPEIGLADGLFNIAVIIHQDDNNDDLAILFASLASYCSPDYPLPQLLIATILEERELYEQANKTYANISTDSYAYYNALFHTAKNLIRLGKNDQAEKIFKKLYDIYPPNPDILTNLGEIARINGRYQDAIYFYQQAIDYYPQNDIADIWPLYFAIGLSYSSAGDNAKAEDYLRKVLKIKPNKITQNHLGYILLLQNKNIEEAFDLIISAYNPTIDDGSVTDSIGWAFYQLGYYDKAVEYLEKASNLAPSEAVICDHLGDAYWQVGRKREARFQWNHALNLKDHSGEFNRQTTEEKIKQGLKSPLIQPFDKNKINEQITQLEKKEIKAKKND